MLRKYKLKSKNCKENVKKALRTLGFCSIIEM